MGRATYHQEKLFWIEEVETFFSLDSSFQKKMAKKNVKQHQQTISEQREED